MAFISPMRTSCLSALRDRKSTRLNSSHDQISYAVFCLKKKKKIQLTRAGKRLKPIKSRDTKTQDYPMCTAITRRVDTEPMSLVRITKQHTVDTTTTEG